MRSVSTFGAFTTARLGIFAAQKGLEVTGHNITNINTLGYTRQKLDQMSLVTGSRDRYQSMYDVNVGNGVLCTGVSQFRDPFLDIRYRNEQSNVGATDSKLSGLEQLSSILDEVGKGKGDGVIEKQLKTIISQLETLSLHAGEEEYDTLVRSAAETLCRLFKTASDDMNTVENSQENLLKQEVDTVNGILRDIRDLNESIRNGQIHGDKSLELRDQRNLLLDQLSQYVKIDVTYENESVGAGITVERLVVKLAGSGKGDPDTEKTTLINGTYGGQMSMKKPKMNDDPATMGDSPYLDKDGNPTADFDKAAADENDNFDMTVTALKDSVGRLLKDAGGNPSSEVALGDCDLYGSIQSIRELLTEEGEFTPDDVVANVDPDAATKRGIPYYQKALDSLAQKFAETFNGANETVYKMDTDGFYLDTDGNQLLDGGGNPFKGPLDADKQAIVDANGVVITKGGPLFSTNSDGNVTQGITAGNISISKGWSSNEYHIVASRLQNPGNQANDNILHMITMMDTKQDYFAKDGDTTPFFNGSFQQMLVKTSGTLANDRLATQTLLENYSISSDERYVSRDSVSGVDLNDEAANLMMYQKSYSAACRLMTTLDEVLDKLINGTGVVGR